MHTCGNNLSVSLALIYQTSTHRTNSGRALIPMQTLAFINLYMSLGHDQMSRQVSPPVCKLEISVKLRCRVVRGGRRNFTSYKHFGCSKRHTEVEGKVNRLDMKSKMYFTLRFKL